MSEAPSGRPQARVHSTCNGFSVSSDNRAPVDRDGPVIRKSIGPPVSRPPATFYITECGGINPVAALIIVLALLSLVLQ